MPLPESGSVLIKKVNENNDFVEQVLSLNDVPAQITGSLIYSDGSKLEEIDKVIWDDQNNKLRLEGDFSLEKELTNITSSGFTVLQLTPSGVLSPVTPVSANQLVNKQYVDDQVVGGLTVGSLDGADKNLNAATISGGSLYLQTADSLNPGLMSTGSQTISGAKTFLSTLQANLNGNVNTIITDDNVTRRLLFVSAGAGERTLRIATSNGTYNPFTNVAGIDISGNAATASNANTVTDGVYTSRSISTSTGLIGGGNLSANRTFSVQFSNGASLNWLNSSGVARAIVVYDGSNNTLIRNYDASSIVFQTNTSAGSVANRWWIEPGGAFRPNGNNTFSIGTSSVHVEVMYTRNLINSNNGILTIETLGQNAIDFNTNNTWRWSVGGPNGHFICSSDGGYNIGVDSSSNRAGRGHFRYAVTVGGTTLSVPFTGKHRYVVASGYNPNTGDAVCLNEYLELEPCSTASGLNCVGIITDEFLDGSKQPPSDLFDSTGFIHPSGTNLYHTASVGDSVCEGLDGIIVCDYNGNIQKGDLLVTSPISGCLMRQDDDIIRSCTVGKSMESINFELEGPIVSGIYAFLYCG